MGKFFRNLGDDIYLWRVGWGHYLERKLSRTGRRFETYKDFIVELLLARRGTYQRPFLHISLIILFVVGFAGAPMLAKAYPGGLPSTLRDFVPPSAVATSLDLSEYSVQTQISEKPRDQVISYTITKGDTLSTVADKFGVSVDTIKWANDLKGDSLSIGDTLKIPPVTGIVHKVVEGETVQSIAKKYKTESQKIVNFPFNDFADPDTFALNVGQTLIVPDGVQIQAAPLYTSLAISTQFAGGTGKLLWPTVGAITQYPIWYHMAFDIANPGSPGVMAADGGIVTYEGFDRFGYGNHILVDHGGGLVTLYGHLAEYYVKPGDRVGRGQVIARMGSTGRSTGMHLHFETRINGALVNPAQFFR